MSAFPAHLEPGVVEGDPGLVGRDPRRMTEQDLAALGHHRRPLLRAIPANCIACAGGNDAEVRRCRLVACDMWPFRMGTNPFHRSTHEYSQEEREAMAERLRSARKDRKPLERLNG